MDHLVLRVEVAVPQVPQMKPVAELSFEQEMRREVRVLKANVSLCLNFVRAIAQKYMSDRHIKKLEDDYERDLARDDDDP